MRACAMHVSRFEFVTIVRDAPARPAISCSTCRQILILYLAGLEKRQQSELSSATKNKKQKILEMRGDVFSSRCAF